MASAQPPLPRSPLRLAAWTARKACETHVVMNVLSLVAVGQLALGDAGLLAGRVYLATMAPVAAITAAWTIVRSHGSQSAEREFAAWYRVPSDSELIFSDGWWLVEPRERTTPPEDGQAEKPGGCQASGSAESS